MVSKAPARVKPGNTIYMLVNRKTAVYYGYYFMNTFICPHCEKEIELSEAITHKFKEEGAKEQEEKHKLEIEKVHKEARLWAEKEAKLKSQKELDLNKSVNQKLEQELQQVKKQRKEDEEKIRIEAQKKAEEDQRLKLKEKDIQLEQAKKAQEEMKQINDGLKRKLEQGSQQLQGEALELDLEDKLRQAFRYDDFEPVPKGISGGDIIQVIKNKFGQTSGSILWEAKRSKDWDKKWLIKLKDDMRKIGATDCILVSDVLPKDTKIYGRIESVWVTAYPYAISLASVLREGIQKIMIAKSAASHPDEKLKKLYDLITSDTVRHIFESRAELIEIMKLGVEFDRKSMERALRRREKEIIKLEKNNTQLYDEIQEIIPTLPALKEPKVFELVSGENEHDSPYL